MESLPYDLLRDVFSLLSARDIVSLLRTSRALYAYVYDESLWRELSARYGVHSASDFGGRSFYTIYTRLLHVYGPLLGMWASDLPFLGTIIEFRVDSERQSIVGAKWRLPFARPGLDDIESPSMPLAYSFLEARFVDSDKSTDTVDVKWLCVSWKSRSTRVLKNADPPSLHVLSETASSIFAALTGQHEPEVHPDFPDADAPWYDYMRTLPPFRHEVVPAIDKRPKLDVEHIGYTYLAPSEVVKPAALCVRNALPTELELLRGYSREEVDTDGNEHTSGFHPHRFYPLRAGIQAGVEPWADSWRPESLEGLWLGAYDSFRTECLYLSYDPSMNSVRAWKITGGLNVPRGVQSWEIRLNSLILVADAPPFMALERYTNNPRVYAGSGVLSAQGWLIKDRVNAPIFIAIIEKDELIIYWVGNPTLQRCVRYRGERLNTTSELLDVREN